MGAALSPSIAAALLSILAAAPGAAPDTVPLFASDDPLTFTLVADFGAIREDRAEDPEDRPAVLVLEDGDSLSIEVRPRGHFRRDPAFCSFPPLRLDIPEEGVTGTPFEGQDKLKLVVPCRPELEAYQEYVLREMLLYRIYALFTDVSFRVRLAHVTFSDSNGEDEPFTRYAFFIESDEALARRVGGQLLDIPDGKIVRKELLHPGASTRVAIFEYMIGNTDWADARVHNVALLGLDARVVPVPYDFDLSGAVGARYAQPARELPIATVQQRLYLGQCWDGQDLEAAVQPFRDARAGLESLVGETPYMTPEARRETLDYLLQFFEMVATPERARQRMFRDCLR